MRISLALLRRTCLALLAGVLVCAPAAQAGPSSRGKLDAELRARAARPQGRTQVIVRLRSNADGVSVVRRAKAVAGGRLALLNAQVAEIDDAALDLLASDADVISVHHDRPLVASVDGVSAASAAGLAGRGLAFDGSGVGVGVIDSGIASHTDLRDGAKQSRIAGAFDFTGGGSVADEYGHGTHVAGIIAGNGAASKGEYAGIAPGAHLVSLKVLNAQGRGTVSTAIRAIEYAMAVRRKYKLRVLNLSVGAAVTESYETDPLTLTARHAVEAGLVVVAAAGNFGKNANGEIQYGGITAPGNAPWVLTVGAYSTMGTPMLDDDRVAGYSSRGPTAYDYAAKPDVVAPGTGIVSLASPASLFYATKVDYLLGGSLLLSYKPYLSLTGTSMSAPVVSGTVALMLQANPTLTPNMVKAIVQYTAQRYQGYSSLAQGAGFLNTRGAVQLARFFRTAQPGTVMQLPSGWSKQIIWGNHRLSGGAIRPNANAFNRLTTWGAPVDNDGDAIVWGTLLNAGENLVWGTVDSLNEENLVWGTVLDAAGENLVWGTSVENENLVWGTVLDGNGENLVWGTMLAGDNLVWGTSNKVTSLSLVGGAL